MSDPATEALSAREIEILTWASEGYSNSEIGDLLSISENTVKTHLQRILLKMNARNRAHAVAWAVRSGLVP